MLRREIDGTNPACSLNDIQMIGIAGHVRDAERLLEAGVAVTLNSDDPAYFGGYVNENWVQTMAALNLSAAQAWRMARNSFEASFATAAQREALCAALDTYVMNFAAAA